MQIFLPPPNIYVFSYKKWTLGVRGTTPSQGMTYILKILIDRLLSSLLSKSLKGAVWYERAQNGSICE